MVDFRSDAPEHVPPLGGYSKHVPTGEPRGVLAEVPRQVYRDFVGSLGVDSLDDVAVIHLEPHRIVVVLHQRDEDGYKYAVDPGSDDHRAGISAAVYTIEVVD